jgi:Tfp pilus assembly protein PilF
MALRITRVIFAGFFCLGFILALNLKMALSKDKASGALSHYIMGVLYEDLGKINEAIEEYKLALKSDADSSIIHLNLASSFIKANDMPKAIAELESASRLDPEAVEPHAVLALLYTSQNKIDLATKEFEIALKNAASLNPKNADIYKSLGAIYLKQNKLKEAEGMFRLAVDLVPNDAESHFYLGSVYNELKNYSQAEKELSKAADLKPDYHEALNFLGYLWVDQNKNLEKAGNLIRKALAFEPDNGAYVDSLGWYYFRKGNLQEALKEVSRASTLIEDPVVYEHLGDIYLKLGDPEKAKLNWQRALKLDPTLEAVKDKLSKI